MFATMSDASPPPDHVVATAREALTGWLAALADNPVVDEVVEDVEADVERWFVRVLGDAKDVYSVWFTLRQRTLAYETYVMPAPEENETQFYGMLLRRNDRLPLVHFSIGDEQAIFLKGRSDLDQVDDELLDRVLGAFYEAVELCFVPALRVGFATRFDNR